MAGELPLALRRSTRRRPSPGADVAPRTQRKSSRASVVRKPAATRTTAPKKAGKTARSKTKASASDTAAARAAPAAADDTAIDDSITLVDDDSITALDFDIPISPRRPSSGVGKRKRRPSFTPPVKNQPAIKKARRQTGSNSNNNSSNNNKDDDDNDNTNNNSSVVHILPLRTQILDPHIKRRIRRNGLSAEMNEAYEEKKTRKETTLAELRRARDELSARDAEIERLRELTALFDSSRQNEDGEEGEEASRVEELERELERLREQVMGRRHGGGVGDIHDDVQLSSSPPVARAEHDEDDDGWGGLGEMSDGGSDAGGDFGHDFDDEFGESSVAELESGGTPAQNRHHHRQQQHLKGMRPAELRLHGTALTPPSTSPTKLPSSPLREVHSSHGSTAAEAKTSSACDAGVQAATVSADAASQACIPDPGTSALHDELSKLRAEVTGLSDTLQERDSLRARVGEKLARHQLRSTTPPSAQDDTASDQDVELQLDIVLQDLADKTARLAELSSVLMPPTTDDSVTTTTSSDKEATAELASALQGVRQALADIDPDTPLPPAAAPTIALAADQLRELGAALEKRAAELSERDAALAAKNEELAAANAAGSDKEARATNLERDVENLGRTVSSLRDAIADMQADLDGARDSALQQGAAAAEAESRLAGALADLAALTQKLSEREAALRGREGEVDTLRAALAEARRTVAGLRDAAARDKGAAGDAVRAMRAQMIAALKVGEGFLGEQGVAKEEDGVVGVARGRSHDSGLGLEGEQARLV